MNEMHNTLGRRLMAAYLSFSLRISLDYALKTRVPEQVGPFWLELAENLIAVHQQYLADSWEQHLKTASEARSKKAAAEPDTTH